MNRKPRKDSKLHNLPPEHRARVDKWLFDKGLTYQQVADGCFKLFSLKISRSSVARYHERESRQRIATSQRAGRLRPLSRFRPLATPPPQPTARSLEAGFQELLARMTKRALDLATYLTLEWDDAASKEMLQITRVLIAARKERTDGMLAALQRKRFEMWAAKECLRYLAKSLKRDPKGKTFNAQSCHARSRTKRSRFAEEIEQRVDHLIAAEKLRQGVQP
jgi:hypothetical protein